MISAQNTKFAELIIPQSVASTATATATVSCVGFNYASVTLHIGAITTTDSTLTLTEGDGTTFATHADLSMTTAAGNTSTGQYYAWHLDLRKRKKNLKITYTPGATRLAEATCLLTMAQESPDTATERGLAGQVVA